MLTTANEVLARARAERFAIPGFDCVEDVMVRAILETAEENRSAVFMMCLKTDLEGNGWAYLPGLIKAAADHHSVPVVLHLDHAVELDTLKRAVDSGFTSVMIDGSTSEFAENVDLTAAAVEIAKPHGVSVEAELGHVGGMNLAATECADNVLTKPDEVAAFVQQTGVDSLAVSIGTSHGVYQSLPMLNITRLKELELVSPVPLVLHGGSGTPDDQVQEAVKSGICKMNVYAECRQAMGRGLQSAARSQTREDPLPGEVFGPIQKEIAAVVKNTIDLLFAANRF